MRSLKYLFRKLVQWIAGVFYEGPIPPPRLLQSIHAFRFTHPVATRNEWTVFALELAEEAWRQGYQRGYEQRVEDLTQIAEHIAVTVPMSEHAVFKEKAIPHQLETYQHIAETVELRAQSGKVVKMTLDEALKADPELAKQEEDFWRSSAGIGPSRGPIRKA